ncbi:MAG TPA: ATP-binding protein [Steroidobacteraceae bacterium]|jgi:signal transduction histidine kinase|nr:ATP-binding protein [Steroidobacteraceae bacterium]HTL91053.1 ATP-binding protein [Steroidobacteraceae bacterium]
MHSLYWRIFRSFWLAIVLILVGTVTVAVSAAIQRRDELPWVQRGQLFAQAAVAFETGGADSLREWLDSLAPDPAFSRTFVVGPNGRDMLDRPLPRYLQVRLEGRTKHGQKTVRSGAIAPVGGALVLMSPDGSTYHVIVGPMHERPLLFGELELPTVAAATLAIALVVSTVICFFLTRHLVGPIDRLRQATREMAAGDLSVRMLPRLKGRQDDLALLAADFDSMAERVQSLLESKQQLLRDVSHELRSPLTRLQLALSLAKRQDGGPDRQLTRIANEADRLEQLIARILKLVRLERPVAAFQGVPVDVGRLLETIAQDVTIEAEARSCTVSVQTDAGLEVSGDPELLRSAFENVIRNAVRYGPSGSAVVVTAARQNWIEIAVRDHGPGVPEKDLKLIFEPFYRVDAARDRAGGGEGLGLAIAARAIVVHGGSIEARNVAGGGLEISMRLPALQRRAGVTPTAEAA